MKLRRNAFYVFLVVIGLSLAAGCGLSSGSSSSGAGIQPVVDIAAGVRNGDGLYVYRNILNSLTQGRQPDAIVGKDGPDSGMYRTVEIWQGRLFGGQVYNDRIHIWNDVTTLADGQAPDVVLDGGERVNKPSDLFVFAGDLYVCSQDNNEVLIFRDVTTLATDDQPDVILSTVATAGGPIGVGENPLDRPSGLTVTSHALYVVSKYNDMVCIYRDPLALATGDGPDVVLRGNPGGAPLGEATAITVGDSFLHRPIRCWVRDNTLYVNTRDYRDGETINAYMPADGLVDDQAPTYLLGGPSIPDGNMPLCVEKVGDRLFVGTRDWPTGLVAFDAPMWTGKPPDVWAIGEGQGGQSKLIGDIELSVADSGPNTQLIQGMGEIHELVYAGGTLFGTCDQFDGLFGYFDPANMEVDQQPDFLLWWPGMQEPHCLTAVQR